MRNKYRMIPVIVCIAIGMSACSPLQNINAPPSVEAETAREEQHIWTDLTAPEYDSDYFTRSEIPYPVKLDCRGTGKRLLFLKMEVPEDKISIRSKDADWLLVSDDTADGKHLQTYAYRGCPSGGERIIFNPVIKVFGSGLSEEDFSEIHTSIYSQSVYWLERMDIPEREDILNLEPDATGKISDDILEKAYEIFLFWIQTGQES